MGQCYRYRETRENLVPCSRCQARHTAVLRMSETWREETWREEESEDSCSSCSTDLRLYSGDTEIITVDAEHVPGVPNEIERSFLMKRLLDAYRLAMESIRLAQVAQQDGGAIGSEAVQYTDDTVDIVDTQAPDTQDTQAIP